MSDFDRASVSILVLVGSSPRFCHERHFSFLQACYGILKVPRGNWLCRTCALGVQPKCLLCPKRGGALKPTRSGTKWVHVSCALWIPEVRRRGNARGVGCVRRAGGRGLAHTFRLWGEPAGSPHGTFLPGISETLRRFLASSSFLLLIAVLSPLIEQTVFIGLFVLRCHRRGGGGRDQRKKMIARLLLAAQGLLERLYSACSRSCVAASLLFNLWRAHERNILL